MSHCPKCKYEYQPDIKICPDCDAELVADLPEELNEEKKEEWINLVEVASYPTEIQAQEARLLLESYEIRSVIRDGLMARFAWADTGVRLMVRESDYQEARKVLEDK